MIRFHVNGLAQAVEVDAKTPLLDVLRDDLRLAGSRFGCGAGECGACRVLVDGRSQASCTLPMWAAEGAQVTTVEGLPVELRQAFIDEQAAQCGYCSSGMLIGAAALLRRTPQPSEAEVRAALDDHLCRCGAHNGIVRAVLRASQHAP